MDWHGLHTIFFIVPTFWNQCRFLLAWMTRVTWKGTVISGNNPKKTTSFWCFSSHSYASQTNEEIKQPSPHRLPLTLPIRMFKQQYQTLGMPSFLNTPKSYCWFKEHVHVYAPSWYIIKSTIPSNPNIQWWFPHYTDWCRAPTANSSPNSLAKACALPA